MYVILRCTCNTRNVTVIFKKLYKFDAIAIHVLIC